MKNSISRKNNEIPNNEHLENIRNTVNGILAQSVLSLYPTTKLWGWKVTDSWFYYDFDFEEGSIQGEQLKKLEEIMKNIIRQKQNIKKSVISIDDAINQFKEKWDSYKIEILEELKQAWESEITIYGFEQKWWDNIFKDIFEWAALESTEGVKEGAFKLNNVAGAYRKWDPLKKMLTRISWFAFENKEQLQQHLAKIEEAKKRDHKKIWAELEWFIFDSNSPGMPYRLPKGLTIKNLLISFWRQYHKAKWYQEFSAPLLAKKTLYETSGHREHYEDDMMITKVKWDDIDWCVKPMWCPNACTVFKSKPHSYKDLPFRLSDMDTLHRNEVTWTLNWLLRVRSFNQDDSHNFVEEDKVGDEIKEILEIVHDFYKLFGLEKDIKLYLSTMPNDHLWKEETRRKIEKQIEWLLVNSEFKYWIKEKDGAFYWPKIDIHLKDAFDREWQCWTIQIDYQLPQRFGLQYTDNEGQPKIPVIVHRVIYWSLDRFLWILIEHTWGKLPFWLMPNQIKIIPIKETVSCYVENIKKELDNILLMSPLKYNELRYETDERDQSLSRKVKDAILQKIPILMIIWEKEAENNEVTLRINNQDHKIILTELKKFLMNFNENKIQ